MIDQQEDTKTQVFGSSILKFENIFCRMLELAAAMRSPIVQAAADGLSLAFSKCALCAFVFKVEPIVSGPKNCNIFINYCACKIMFIGIGSLMGFMKCE